MIGLAANTALSAEFLQSKFDAGLSFDDYLATDPVKAEKWRSVYQRARLTDAQHELIASFTRRMPVLISSGIWCGDCVQQCPLIQRIAEANPRKIELKLVDRDEHLDLSQRIVINAGLRVPTVIFMAEDFEFVHLLGDRTLSRYRAVAARQLGPHCPLPGAPIGDDELAATMQDWVNEFERVHLLLRLSQRLREKYGD
jgi:thiol-disulfide isomerase/thioredoxin